MEFLRTPRQAGRRPSPCRPRSRIYRKKNLVKRVASTLRRRRSQLHGLYQNALIQMAESKLNIPHEGQPGLIYAVAEIPSGHSRQSLINVFDGVVANMSAATSKSSSQRSWETYHLSHEASSTRSTDLLTGKYESPEDFDCYLVWQPLKPLPPPQSSKANAKTQELTELTWSPPRTPSKTSNESLIDLDTPISSGPPTPPDVLSSSIDELFFGGLSEALTSPPLLPSESLASLDATLFPQPLNFKDSPFPVFESTQLIASIPGTPRKVIHKRATHGNLRIDTQHPALQVTCTSPGRTAIETPSSAQPARLLHRKPVFESPIRRKVPQQWLTSETPTPYRPYRPEVSSASLPPVLTRTADSLLDEMKDEIEKVMASFSPLALVPEQSWHAPTKKPSQLAVATGPPKMPALSSSPLPLSHRIPIRTTSRTATTTTITMPKSPFPPFLVETPTSTALHSSSSFRSRLGASTLQALLTTADRPSPTSAPAEPYSWHRWVDRARDQDSETEEQEHQRKWRQKRRDERRRMMVTMKGEE